VKRILIAAAATALVTATACGAGGGGDEQSQSGAAATRTVEVDMVDTAFQPTTVTAKAGERIRFVFHNRGQAAHDAFIGDVAAQADHEQDMRRAEEGGHGGGHGDDTDEDALTLDPGKKGELTSTFERAGTVEIGCHQPGHYAAGMKIAVTVT
jgi:uncharacterized cupredoxin-like copper-binding protein